MKQFKLLNNVFAWLSFAVAAFTYLSTMEPTASFWDCPEFITTAFKLEVGHPPGAPFFMLMGRFFSLFASDTTQVAYMVNSLSALASAGTILFLFWTITRLGGMLLKKEDGTYSLAQTIGLIGAGLVGSLSYAFSDTFWFSAVEGEVYASSSLFTAVVFWAILKWESVADKANSDRWLILIAYLMGLSIGVHLLNLLAIPAIVLVYYFKKFDTTKKGTFYAFVFSGILLGLLMYGLVPGVVEVASWFELFFVNSLGFSFNSGVIIFGVILMASLIWSIYETFVGTNQVRIKTSFVLSLTLLGVPFIGASVILGLIIIAGLIALMYYVKNLNVRLMNTIMVALTTIVIGYSSYAIIVIRSAANPPMDQNSPDNIFSLQMYLNREQYGDRPLLYGQNYSADIERKAEGEYCVPVKDEGERTWTAQEKMNPNQKDKYIEGERKYDYKYVSSLCTLFPRMYSPQPGHVEQYKEWANIKGKKVRYETCGQTKVATDVPTFADNLKFFFSYQLGHMYGRYFMWNFAGRQNDQQGHGDIEKGNWISGFNFIDKYSIGDISDLPDSQLNDKSRNVYYLLPLILGFIGVWFQFQHGRKGNENFVVTFLLFFMTGIAIVLYLNQYPLQPRERDYAYAGSFYAYTIWIGLGVLGVTLLLEKLLKNKTLSASVSTVVCLAIPIQMAAQNWDDHDRSNRFTTRDFGANYLNSCAPNAIIFTNGDNDTFPLWYCQEVEGIRTDVRVCNLSYLQTDWYIDQMRRDAYDSKALPISWKRFEYVQGVRDQVMIYDVEDIQMMTLDSAINNYVLNPEYLRDGIGAIPTRNLFTYVDKDQVIKSGTVRAELRDSILPIFPIQLQGQRLLKHEMMILEMIKENKWKRPIYYSVTVGEDYYMGMGDHFQLEGLAYRVVPMGMPGSGEKIDVNIMYDNMMNKFKWGNADQPGVYMDENNIRMCKTFRMMFARLISELLVKGENQKALLALDKCMKVLPHQNVPHDYSSTFLAAHYYQLGQPKKGDEIMRIVAIDCVQNLKWFNSLKNKKQRKNLRNKVAQNLGILQQILMETAKANRPQFQKEFGPEFTKYEAIYNSNK